MLSTFYFEVWNLLRSTLRIKKSPKEVKRLQQPGVSCLWKSSKGPHVEEMYSSCWWKGALQMWRWVYWPQGGRACWLWLRLQGDESTTVLQPSAVLEQQPSHQSPSEHLWVTWRSAHRPPSSTSECWEMNEWINEHWHFGQTLKIKWQGQIALRKRGEWLRSN